MHFISFLPLFTAFSSIFPLISFFLTHFYAFQGEKGIGMSGRYELPAKVIAQLQAGRELADVVDELSGDHDVRSKGGAMGTFYLYV